MAKSTNEPLSYGISLPNRAALFGVPLESLIQIAVRAEASGQFDSVWVGDNFLSKPRVEAIVLLSALAARTSRMKLGTICLASFPLRHPIPLALQWASLDLLSGGRTILVVCNGAAASMGPQFAAELKAMGMRSVDRVARLEEGIEILRGFFGPEPFTHNGKFYQFEDVNILPKPVQQKVPIVIAVNPPWYGDPAVEERALRRVARISDGWQSDGVPVELFKRRWDSIQEYAEEYGRADEVNHASLHIMVNINDDAQKAHAESVKFLAEYYGQGTVTPEKLENWLAFGSPSQVIETIHQYIEAGSTTPVLRFTSWDQAGQLERCIDEVMPTLQKIRAQKNGESVAQ
jgi:alkanesulfonate monooxygenase SsuD/methylene tetrahydromethanopterin reductase-like flavin-dependent oxidoreductase (luciferase family)